MTDLNPQFVAQVNKIKSVLDTLDYYQLLRIPYEAGDEEIRAGYHAQARTFHPDRYNYLGAPELVKDLTAIAKRITEAYLVLRDAEKREPYLASVQGPERANRLRYSETHVDEKREREQARLGATPQGRKAYEQAMAAWGNGDRDTAISHLKMALMFEKDNTAYNELLAQWTGDAAP